MSGHVLGIIGGSGLYDIEGLEAVEEVRVATPYGEPSDTVVRGRLGEVTLLFLPRHGRGHHELCPHRRCDRRHKILSHEIGAMKIRGIFLRNATRIFHE